MCKEPKKEKKLNCFKHGYLDLCSHVINQCGSRGQAQALAIYRTLVSGLAIYFGYSYVDAPFMKLKNQMRMP